MTLLDIHKVHLENRVNLTFLVEPSINFLNLNNSGSLEKIVSVTSTSLTDFELSEVIDFDSTITVDLFTFIDSYGSNEY